MSNSILLWLAGGFLRLIARVRIEGRENVPRQGAAIITINHLALFDPLLGFVAANRADMTGWVADKHKKNAFFAFIINWAGGIWLNREEVDMQALRKALQALKKGRLFGLAPEGTRSPTGAMIPAKEGASFLAVSSGAPIVPVALMGTEMASAMWRKWRRPTLTVRIGQPYHLPSMENTSRHESLQRGTDEIMCRIAVLLLPKYRGVYSDHPRLRELLAAAA